MAIAHLVTQKVQEVHFTNKLTKQGQIQLDASFTFHVNFAKDGERCIAKVYQSIKDKENSDQLFVSVDIIGAFACKDVVTEEDKKQIHAQCYDQLFPYIQSTVQSLMQASGIPGFQLRKAVIDPANVQVGQPPHAAEPEKPQFPIV
jgi:preprotein translocase subunit SecB